MTDSSNVFDFNLGDHVGFHSYSMRWGCIVSIVNRTAVTRMRFSEEIEQLKGHIAELQERLATAEAHRLVDSQVIAYLMKVATDDNPRGYDWLVEALEGTIRHNKDFVASLIADETVAVDDKVAEQYASRMVQDELHEYLILLTGEGTPPPKHSLTLIEGGRVDEE